MKLVIDTNIIIAALIKNSLARQIILFTDIEFISPEFTIDEVNKYKELILAKSSLNEKEFDTLFSTILGRIDLIHQSNDNSNLAQAEQLMGKIDLKDIPFLALALSTKNDGIWSEDIHFEKQNKIKVWKTSDVVKLADELGLNY